MIRATSDLDKIRALAEERATRLASAYDVDADTKTAFIHDVALEIVEVVRAFLRATEDVQAKNALHFQKQHSNRTLRRSIKDQLRKR